MIDDGQWVTTPVGVTVTSGDVTSLDPGDQATFVRIHSESGDFNLCGIKGGVQGRRLLIYFDVSDSRAVEITNESTAEGTTDRRIYVTKVLQSGGSDKTFVGPAFAEFIYLTEGAHANRWHLVSVSAD